MSKNGKDKKENKIKETNKTQKYPSEFLQNKLTKQNTTHQMEDNIGTSKLKEEIIESLSPLRAGCPPEHVNAQCFNF